VTARKLRERGIERLVDVRTVEDGLLRGAVGSMADWLRQLANGIDDRPVVPHRDVKSSGSENTYAEDVTDLATIRQEIAEMATHAVSWLVRRELLARTVTIKVRYSDFSTITRSHTALASRAEREFVERAVQLLEKTEAGVRPIRLLGVSVHNLCNEAGIAPVSDPEGWLPFSE
jgi:DNA polymerase-4